jgi:hypothetical protein
MKLALLILGTNVNNMCWNQRVQEIHDPKEDDMSIMGSSVICTSGLVLVEQQILDSHSGFGKRLKGEGGEDMQF